MLPKVAMAIRLGLSRLSRGRKFVDLILVLLRILHIVLGVFWAGSVFFVASFVLPTARAAGPAGGPFMRRFAMSGFINALTGSGVITVLTGLALMWYASGQLNAAWFGSPTGIVLSIGALSAIVALGIGLAVSRPAAMRMKALAEAIEAAGGTPTEAQLAELPALQAKMAGAVRWVSILLLIAVICMAGARYVTWG
jgi:hypothetical protein